jgi:hypothetical protein
MFLFINSQYGISQKNCRQNYKNEISLSYNNLLDINFAFFGLSCERVVYHKKKKNDFVSVQFDYLIASYLQNPYIYGRISSVCMTPSIKYNFGDQHIYSIGAGASLIFLKLPNVSPVGTFNYKYDFKKHKLTIGVGLQISYFGLAMSEEYYDPNPPTHNITSTFWSPYNYKSIWKDHILFNIRAGKYF